MQKHYKNMETMNCKRKKKSALKLFGFKNEECKAMQAVFYKLVCGFNINLNKGV